MTGQGATYQTGSATYSTIYAGDNTNSSIENNNPTGALFGYLGAGSGAGIGDGETNSFTTDPGSTSAFAFGTLPGETAQTNTLYSSGQDTVSIAGPSPGQSQSNEVVTSGSGADSISLLGGASLSFVNQSAGVSTIEASSGSAVGVSGSGSTSVQAGGGNETFNVDTASGNVTLTGSTASGAADAFDFKAATSGETATGTATEVVNNFTSSDAINLTGYGTVPGAAYTATTSAGSTVLTLSDHTTITITGVSNPSVVTSHITLK